MSLTGGVWLDIYMLVQNVVVVRNMYDVFVVWACICDMYTRVQKGLGCLCGWGGGVVTEWAHQRLTPSMVILSSSSSLLPSLSLSSSGVATIGTSLNILPILVLFAIINVFKCLYLNRFTQLFAYISVYVGMFLCIFCILWKGSQICCTSLSCHPVWL